MSTKQKYQAVIAKIEAIVGDHRVYITDEMIDRENTPVTLLEDTPEFWTAMIASAIGAARDRGEEAGLSAAKLKLIGRAGQ